VISSPVRYVIRRVKASLDPRGIVNPDKVFALEEEKSLVPKE